MGHFFSRHSGVIYQSVILANSEFMLLDVSELLVWSVVKVFSVLSRVVSSAYIIGEKCLLGVARSLMYINNNSVSTTY